MVNYTINNPLIPNISATTYSCFAFIWSLTRSLKKAGWKYKGSANGTTKDGYSGGFNADGYNDYWGSGISTGNTGLAATIASPINGQAIVTGLAGITASDKGRFLKITGSGNAINNHSHQIEAIISATSVKIDARNFSVVADTPGFTWVIIDPLLDSIPATVAAAKCWWCAQGPSTIKIPITAQPTVNSTTGADFIRGENVVSSSGFEGELISYVFDGLSSGYLVINPRLRGSGAWVGSAGNQWGIGVTDVFTGSYSGATVTCNGTPLEYVQQIVFQKNTGNLNGTSYMGCFELSSSPDSTESFSACIINGTNVTGTVGPGCSATLQPGNANGCPQHAYLMRGNYSDPARVYFLSDSAQAPSWGKGFSLAFDCLPEQNYSADGSFITCISRIDNSHQDCSGMIFARMDNVENGELDPFLTYGGGNISKYAGLAGRYTNNSGNSENGVQCFGTTQDYGLQSTTCVDFRGWRRRGLSGEIWQDYDYAQLYSASTSTFFMRSNALLPEKTASTILATRVLDPIWAICNTSTYKQRKGTFKNFFFVQGGFRFDTFQNKTWIQIACGFGNYSSTSASYPALCCSGWDGTTVQLSY